MQLAKKLAKYRGEDAIVLALPRGGVVVGYEVAHALDLPLDIVVVRKIGHPSHEEFAIGAIDERGTILLSEQSKSVDPKIFAQMARKELEEAKRRAELYRAERLVLPIKDKTVILVDDGVATGLTMRLAIKVVKDQDPRKVIVAVPVAAADTAAILSREADELITLEDPREFLGAVGAHYVHFDQTSDQEVIRLLHVPPPGIGPGSRA